EAVLTSPDHQSGTERVSEVVASKAFSTFDLILNVQGDEPLVAPEAVRGAVARVRAGDPIGTAAGALGPALAGGQKRGEVVCGAAPAAPGVDTADDLRYAEATLARQLREVSP